MSNLSEVAHLLAKSRHVLIVTHLRPDGDALGSSLGLARILRTAGINAQTVGLTPVPPRYQFLPEPDELGDIDTVDLSDVDLVAVLDAGAIDRTHPFVEQIQGRTAILNIDHHQSNTFFGDTNHVDPKASSVGEIVWRIATDAEWTIPAAAAEALWVAIVTDTGRFAYDNTSPEAMAAAGDLLTCGVRTSWIDHMIFSAMPLRQMRLQERAMASIALAERGRLATVAITRDDLAAVNAQPGDTEDIINIPRSIEGVEIAVFFCELPDDPVIKVSFRTTEPYDAAALCKTFGGGGHQRAAGCSIDSNMDETQRIVLERIHDSWFRDESQAVS